MPRVQFTEQDVDPQNVDRLRRKLNSLLDSHYDALAQIGNLQTMLAATQSNGLTASEQAILQALSVGSVSTAAPSTTPVIPTVTSLPPANTSSQGQLVRSGGQVYVFDGTAWVTLTAAAAAHNLLSATHPDTVAASPTRGDLIVANATPAWARFARGAAFQLLRMNAGATDPEYGTVDDTMLSANVALLNAANLFSGRQQFDRPAVTLQLAGASPYTITGAGVFVGVNTGAGAYTVKMPPAPGIGDLYVIIDFIGSAAANNITVNGNGSNIDGAATSVIATNYGVLRVFYTGSVWKIW